MGKRNTAPRDLKALQLRMAGLSFDQIADRLDFANRGSAYKAYRRAAEARTDSRPLSEDEARDLELARLDALQAAIYPKAARGDLQAVDRMLKITAQRSRLLGLNVSVNAPAATTAPAESGGNVVSIADHLSRLRTSLPGAGS